MNSNSWIPLLNKLSTHSQFGGGGGHFWKVQVYQINKVNLPKIGLGLAQTPGQTQSSFGTPTPGNFFFLDPHMSITYM